MVDKVGSHPLHRTALSEMLGLVFTSCTALPRAQVFERPGADDMPSPKPVRVTMRALLQRINRRLRLVGGANGGARQIKRGRGGDAGGFYILDLARNEIMAWGIDPVETGRRMGVLAPWQEVVE